MLGEELVLADIGRDHLSDLARGKQPPEADTVDARIVRDDRQALDARRLNGVDQRLGDAAQAEAAGHDDHVVAQDPGKGLRRRRINLPQASNLPLAGRRAAS